MEDLESKLGYTFKNKSLLTDALTHSSYANENRAAGAVCNERLEFLGDAVLGFVVAGYLYGKYKDLPEGKMTRLRAELVCETSLNGVATAIDLGGYLRLGRGEERGGGRTRTSIKADAVEAVLAAIYLDGGLEPAESFVRRFILDVYEAGEAVLGRDYKSELQELVQRKNGRTLEYVLVATSGPDHSKTFTVEARLNGRVLASGDGHSKKDAEQKAAKRALEVLE